MTVSSLTRALTVGCALALTPVGSVAMARAEPATDATLMGAKPAGTLIVRVSDAAPPLPLERLVEALRSQLAELRVTVELRSDTLGSNGNAPNDTIVAVVWLERSGESLVVRFYEPVGSNLRERSIPVSGTDAASVEEVALVVRSAVSALLEGSAPAARSPVAKPAAPSPSAPPPTAPVDDRAPASQPMGLEVSGAYVLTRYAKESAWQHGAAFAIEWRHMSHAIAAGLTYTWLPLLETSTSDLAVTLRRHPLEAFLAVPWQAESRTLRVEPGMSLIADPITRSSRALSAELETTPSTTLWSWAVSARLAVGVRPTPGVWLFAAGCADVLLNRFEHVTEGPDGSGFLSPLPVRPRIQLGGAADF